MPAAYIDTSALGRVLLGEPDTEVILRELERFEQHVASRLLRVELRRLAYRHELLESAAELLASVALVPMDAEVLDKAETLAPPTLGALGAIHLATALRLADGGILDTVITYDARLGEGSTHHGLTVISPS